LKQIFIVIIILFLWFHVKDGRNNSKKVVKRVPKKSEFGFVYSDFNVVHDTVKKEIPLELYGGTKHWKSTSI
jgi:hypothetical protein